VGADRALSHILDDAAELHQRSDGRGVVVLLEDADLLLPHPSRRLQASMTEVDHGLIRALYRLEVGRRLREH